MAMDWADRIGRRVKLRDLHILLAVAQWGSMAGAARHLSTSQPVVSKTIAELEHALGARLLDHDLEAEALYEDRLFVVAAADSPWARRRTLTLADLAGEPWVNAPADSIVGSYLAEVFNAQGLSPPQVSVVSFSMYLRNM